MVVATQLAGQKHHIAPLSLNYKETHGSEGSSTGHKGVNQALLDHCLQCFLNLQTQPEVTLFVVVNHLHVLVLERSWTMVWWFDDHQAPNSSTPTEDLQVGLKILENQS